MMIMTLILIYMGEPYPVKWNRERERKWSEKRKQAFSMVEMKHRIYQSQIKLKNIFCLYRKRIRSVHVQFS